MCKYCKRKDFKSPAGLNCHQRTSARCGPQARAARAALEKLHAPTGDASFDSSISSIAFDNNDNDDNNISLMMMDDDDNDNDLNVADISMIESITVATDDLHIIDQQDDESWGLGSFHYNAPAKDDVPIAEKCLDQFRQYVKDIGQNAAVLSVNEKRCIRLMHLLRRKGASLDTYEEVMKWHLEETGTADPRAFIGRKELIAKLWKRYNLPPDFIKQRNIVLPTGAKVNVVSHDPRHQVVSILTDPRLGDDDWLHFGDDPLAPPPDSLTFLADINTGLAYTETYKKLITKPGKQMLVPIIMYIDGAVTGQFDKLQVEALKMTLGILKRSAREREHAWRTIGKNTRIFGADSPYT